MAEPFWHDDHLTLYGGDCREVLMSMAPESVHCVVTSPPYWGLRDYGLDERGLGLEPTPEEYVANMVAVFREVRRVLRADGTLWLNLGDSYVTSPPGRGPQPGVSGLAGINSAKYQQTLGEGHGTHRGTLGAMVGGLKPKDLVGIPWRVAFALQADGWYLRSDIIWSKPNPMPESVTDRPTKAHEYLFLFAKGQWKSRVVQVADLPSQRLHLGEDFGPKGSAVGAAGEFAVRLAAAISNVTEPQQDLGLRALDAEVRQERSAYGDGVAIGDLPIEHRASVLSARLLSADMSAKEFLGEFHRLGIALADRDHLRVGGIDAEVPLPPSVSGYGERSVAIHHAGEVREFDLVHNTIITSSPTTCTYYFDADAVREPANGKNHHDLTGQGYRAPGQTSQRGNRDYFEAIEADDRDAFYADIDAGRYESGGRNLRTVWTIATEPYPGAHFATFPRKLVEPCVKAGTSERGVCPECGAPWVRGTSTEYLSSPTCKAATAEQMLTEGRNRNVTRMGDGKVVTTTGWRPVCAHEAEPVPAVVLDPFAGSGTTLLVAQSLGRRGIGIDLNPEYLQQALARNAQTPLGLVG